MKKNSYLIKALIFITALALISSIVSSRMFSNQSGTESNRISQGIAKYIENGTAEIFPIDRNDTFWRVNLNQIIRKAAHFGEYLLIGIFACMLFNLITKKISISFLLSITFCPILAFLDEKSQQNIVGRNSQIFDIKLDTLGAYVGIGMVTFGIIIFKYILLRRTGNKLFR